LGSSNALENRKILTIPGCQLLDRMSFFMFVLHLDS
jgi:hypothetical protein